MTVAAIVAGVNTPPWTLAPGTVIPFSKRKILPSLVINRVVAIKTCGSEPKALVIIIVPRALVLTTFLPVALASKDLVSLNSIYSPGKIPLDTSRACAPDRTRNVTGGKTKVSTSGRILMKPRAKTVDRRRVTATKAPILLPSHNHVFNETDLPFGRQKCSLRSAPADGLAGIDARSGNWVSIFAFLWALIVGSDPTIFAADFSTMGFLVKNSTTA